MRFKSEAVTVSKDDIIRFAREYDPQPFHLDEEAAKKSSRSGAGLLCPVAHGGDRDAACRKIVEAVRTAPVVGGRRRRSALAIAGAARRYACISRERWWTWCPRAQNRKASPASNGPPITRRASRSTPSDPIAIVPSRPNSVQGIASSQQRMPDGVFAPATFPASCRAPPSIDE